MNPNPLVRLVSLAFIASTVIANGAPASIVPCSPWPATDALGRSLPTPEQTGLPRQDRFVGIFYFLWHTDCPKNPSGDGPYDIAKILRQDSEAIRKPDSPLWGGIGVSHYWGEPLNGYYRTTDPWVIRRHALLLAEAGIDTLIFDTTNAETYPDSYRALCEVFRSVRLAGGRTPQIAFMVNTKAGATATRLYRDLYQPQLYSELWFRWQGKPLLICDPAEAQPEWREFFTLRRAHWPFTMTNTAMAWHWEASYPQPYGYTDDPNVPEQVNVSVAQNLRRSDGKVTNMSAGDARGRSFHNGRSETAPDAVNQGYNFQEQWSRAFQLNAPFVMVTGWNEWIAGRWGQLKGPLVFVDQFDEECSRDIEPMKGGHGDNYYYQLVANVRRFKGVAPLARASASKRIRLAGDFAQWQEVGPAFPDSVGDTAARGWNGVAGTSYTNQSGRNDIVLSKVARDSSQVYFYVQTRQALTSPTSSNWMWLLIDRDQNAATGWEGYDFIVNRTVEPDGQSWLEQNQGGWNWKRVARVKVRIENERLQLAIPRAALNLPKGKAGFTLDFKWADNLPAPGNVMDFYCSGDVAPEGRFNFRYRTD